MPVRSIECSNQLSLPFQHPHHDGQPGPLQQSDPPWEYPETQVDSSGHLLTAYSLLFEDDDGPSKRRWFGAQEVESHSVCAGPFLCHPLCPGSPSPFFP